MKMYGNNHTKLSGIIRDIQKQQLLIEFPEYSRQLCIPTAFIHTHGESKINQRQELEIDTWYLKKTRILPLQDNRN